MKGEVEEKMSINLWNCKKCERDFETERNSSKNTIHEPPNCPHCGSNRVEWVGFSAIFAMKK